MSQSRGQDGVPSGRSPELMMPLEARSTKGKEIIRLPQMPPREQVVEQIVSGELEMNDQEYQEALHNVGDAMGLVFEALVRLNTIRDSSTMDSETKLANRRKMFNVIEKRFAGTNSDAIIRVMDALDELIADDERDMLKAVETGRINIEIEELKKKPEIKKAHEKMMIVVQKVNKLRQELYNRLKDQEEKLELGGVNDIEDDIRGVLSDVSPRGELEFDAAEYGSNSIKVGTYDGELSVGTYDPEDPKMLNNVFTISLDATPNMEEYYDLLIKKDRYERQRTIDREKMFEDDKIREQVEEIEQARHGLLEKVRKAGGELEYQVHYLDRPIPEEIQTAMNTVLDDGKVWIHFKDKRNFHSHDLKKVIVSEDEGCLDIRLVDKDNKTLETKTFSDNATPGYDEPEKPYEDDRY